jgi:uncharacterized protein (DUF433 family)
MKLPEFLEADDGGFVQLAGHRIGLHHVARMYAEGSSPEMIAAHYPALPLALIRRVIAFYLENQPEVDQYASAHDQEIDRQIAGAPAAPTMAELRRRLQRMNPATSGAE